MKRAAESKHNATNSVLRTIRAKSPSIRQLAEDLDVSVATVSRALNNHPEVSPETRERVLAYAAEANYRKRSTRRSVTKAVGVLYPSVPAHVQFGNFESAMITGIVSGLREQRYSLTIVDAENDRFPDESLTEFLQRKGLSGVLVRTFGADASLLEELAESPIEAVLLADRSDDPRLNFIYNDSRADSARAINHLHHLGHRRIGLIIHDVMDHDHADRLAGYRQGLERNGLEYDERVVIQASSSAVQTGARALDKMLSLDDPPTAVYVTNPIPTVGLLQRCLELGLVVPRDFSVVGFDDRDTRFHTFPQYTAVWQDATQMGLEAALWLSRRLEGVASDQFRERRSTVFSVHDTSGPVPERPLRLGHDRVSLIGR
ncbi:MAG: LacI family DNA-binding transcriptional regulator [Planctomycetota bacterium]